MRYVRHGFESLVLQPRRHVVVLELGQYGQYKYYQLLLHDGEIVLLRLIPYSKGETHFQLVSKDEFFRLAKAHE